MTYFIIAGKLNCSKSTHALHVAEFLSKHLPHFKYTSIIKSVDEWPTWLDQMNSLNNWHETKCPIIWKEVSRMGGKAYLIGSLGEFWEYCYDYYGFQSTLSQDDLRKIMADNLLIQASETSDVHVNSISIISKSNSLMLQFIIYELQKSFPIKKGENLEIKIYDKSASDDVEQIDNLLSQVEESKNILKYYCHGISVVCSMEQAIQNCDILIVTDDFSRKDDEDMDVWLERCRTEMVYLADDININAKRDLYVILSHPGPVCFTASVLMEYCTSIKLTNIVAVTADEGICTISLMAEKTGKLVEDFWCPPVWGFSGLSSFVNVGCMPLTTPVIRPYKRALKTKETTKLPKGEIQYEFTVLENISHIDDSFFDEIEKRKQQQEGILKRKPILAKLRALMSLLKLWFSEEISDDIISLGICSNGGFNFPPGICFSQPVSLNEKRIWQPESNMIMHKKTIAKNAQIVKQVKEIFEKFEFERTVDLHPEASSIYV